ncbi:MAG TPA: PEP-CTERM sorting domain-containing protein [Phycisphaerae bacterium]|nr:PEP-CTERM sorting domain-containing protein [Phycisphaerae bacterium]
MAKYLFAASVCAVLVLTFSAGARATSLTSAGAQLDTDWQCVGLGGLRGIGNGTITLAGVSGTVSRAYLYWHGPTDVANGNTDITFNGNAITGTSVGVGGDNCWGMATSEAYRADVTPLISGNGGYTVANLRKTGVEINGVSLLVFFDDGNAANNRDVYLYEGTDTIAGGGGDPAGWDATFAGINYGGGAASILLGVSDGQIYSDADTLLDATVLVPGPNAFQGDSVPDAGSAAQFNGGLWDLKSFDITSYLSLGTNSLHLTAALDSDCLGLIHVAVDVPTATGVVPEPLTMAGLVLGIGGLVGYVRKRR